MLKLVPMLLLALLPSCDKMVKLQKDNPDNVFEEIVESIIEETTGLDIDLTPGSKESK